MSSDSITIGGGVEDPAGSRHCCLLAPTQNAYSRILEVGDITIHKYGNGGFYEFPERWGLIYTSAAGFVDIAHVRDMMDLTRFYYLQLGRSHSAESFAVFEGAGD